MAVAVECIFTWYWLADLCSRENIAFVLGHALYMKAIHGGKAKNDKQMTSVLGNAVLALLESEQGGTLADLRRFLIEPDFRKAFLQTVRDRKVIYYWRKEFSLLAGKPQAPLLTRLDTFLRPRLIRYMVAQKENKLDFRKIMDEQKIFLAKLTQGAIGMENSYLLGTLLVSKLNQLALSR